MQHSLLFFTLMFFTVVSAMLKDTLVDSETVYLWLVDHSFDRAIKTLCCL